MNEYHCHSLPLKAFVSGLLNEEETEILILHTSECESCFEELNQLWGESGFTLLEDVPSRDSLASSELEEQVFRSLHRSNMWAQLILLVTQGTIQVIFGVLRPFFNIKWSEIFSRVLQANTIAPSSVSAKE